MVRACVFLFNFLLYEVLSKTYTKAHTVREGAKFIGLHQEQPNGGPKGFWEEKMTGQTLFLKKK